MCFCTPPTLLRLFAPRRSSLVFFPPSEKPRSPRFVAFCKTRDSSRDEQLRVAVSRGRGPTLPPEVGRCADVRRALRGRRAALGRALRVGFAGRRVTPGLKGYAFDAAVRVRGAARAPLSVHRAAAACGRPLGQTFRWARVTTPDARRGKAVVTCRRAAPRTMHVAPRSRTLIAVPVATGQ